MVIYSSKTRILCNHCPNSKVAMLFTTMCFDLRQTQPSSVCNCADSVLSLILSSPPIAFGHLSLPPITPDAATFPYEDVCLDTWRTLGAFITYKQSKVTEKTTCHPSYLPFSYLYGGEFGISS